MSRVIFNVKWLITVIVSTLQSGKTIGWTENAGVDIDGVAKKRGWTMQEWTMTE